MDNSYFKFNLTEDISLLNIKEKSLLADIGFPLINFPFGIFNTFVPLNKELESHIRFENECLFTIAEDRERMTKMVIRLSDHSLCFFESWDHELIFVNTSLQSFFDYCKIFMSFFSENPEFDDDYTPDEKSLKKVRHLENILKSIDHNPFKSEDNAWVMLLNEMRYE